MAEVLSSWVDGVEQSSIDLHNRGLHYGDGLFETLRVVNHQVPLLDYHLERLQSSAARMKLDVSQQTLQQELDTTCASLANGVIKLVLSRLFTGRGYAASSRNVQRIMMTFASSSPTANQQGIRARICDTRLAIQPALAGMKHLNRLEQVLARSEWQDINIAEGLMCNTRGQLVEGTMSNLFAVIDNTLITAPVDECGVAGVMRELLLDRSSALQIKSETRYLDMAELDRIDEMFVCNSVVGIWPVIELEQHRYNTGSLTKILQQDIRQHYHY